MGLWNYVSFIGISEEDKHSLRDPKRLVFFNQVLFIGFFATLFQVISMWPFLGTVSLIFLVISFASAISLLLNSQGHFRFSKIMFMLVVYSIGTYTTTLIGGAGLYHLGTFAIFASSLIIFDIRSEKIEILLGIPFVVLTIAIGEFGWFNAPDFSGHESISIMRFSSITNLLVINSILTIFIIRLNNKNEDKLSVSKQVLEGLVIERTSELTAQKSMLEKQNAEKEVLLKEVHHRVKNNLQIIVSLINLQLSKHKGVDVQTALKNIQGRVLSMSIAHQEMYKTSDFTEIGLKEYIESLVGNIKLLYGDNNVKYTLNIDSSTNIDVERAIPIGLIFNEVITNFFKHVVKEDSSSFTITMEYTDGTFLMTYSDNGLGFPADYEIENSSSLGMQLIESLTEQIDGDFKFFNDGGAVYKISFEN